MLPISFQLVCSNRRLTDLLVFFCNRLVSLSQRLLRGRSFSTIDLLFILTPTGELAQQIKRNAIIRYCQSNALVFIWRDRLCKASSFASVQASCDCGYPRKDLRYGESGNHIIYCSVVISMCITHYNCRRRKTIATILYSR
jgi:hypothetical protein